MWMLETFLYKALNIDLTPKSFFQDTETHTHSNAVNWTHLECNSGRLGGKQFKTKTPEGKYTSTHTRRHTHTRTYTHTPSLWASMPSSMWLAWKQKNSPQMKMRCPQYDSRGSTMGTLRWGIIGITSKMLMPLIGLHCQSSHEEI